MKGLSRDEERLLHELYKPTSNFALLDKSNDMEQEIFSYLAKSGSMVTLLHLLPLAVARKESAIETIHIIMKRHSYRKMISLDQHVRRINLYNYSPIFKPWYELQPTDVTSVLLESEQSVTFIGVCTFHSNGYVREAAVKKLGNQFSGLEIPFLLLRLNDFIPTIRFLAFKALKQRIQTKFARNFLLSISLVKHLEIYYNREKFTDLVEEIYRLLKMDDCRTELVSGFHSYDLDVRRFCFLMACNLPDMNHNDICSQAFAQKDMFIRLYTLQQVSTNLSKNELMNWLKCARTDVSPPVRQCALKMIVDIFPEQAPEELIKALLDRNKTIRETARYYLREKQIDYAAYYREKLSHSEQQVIQVAITGLGETGSKTDASWILAFINHEKARISSAAVKALSNLDADNYEEVFITSLQADKRGVSREARQALSQLVTVSHAERLWDIYQEDDRIHVQKNILTLFKLVGKQDSIFYLLRACIVSKEEVRVQAERYVITWIRGYGTIFYISLSKEKWNVLQLLLQQVNNYLSQNTVDEMTNLIERNKY
ncbi:HEAT repeat domain-containing protein [Brevibacillus laterosporus]|nr:HEAT repeat domain-containing protein [Brevibacillus laterosporus]TPG85656.1 HEAT repeat domain-containing protein [Brevibacillus laterosporus]